MKKTSEPVPFGKAFLAALFAGILASTICLAYNIYFRMTTYYSPSDIINVSSIIFIINILLLIAGTIYYACKIWSENGDLLYIIFFIALLAFCIWKTAGIQRFADQTLNREFIHLLTGTIVITGLGILCVPYFFNNKKILDFYYEADV